MNTQQATGRGKLETDASVIENMRVETRGIECDSIMCGCSQNPKGTIRKPMPTNSVSLTSRDMVTFDEFYEIMAEKIKEARPNQNIIFESSKLSFE